MIKSKLIVIKDLTKIFLKDSYQDLNIFDKKNKNINMKSIYVWMSIIIFFVLLCLSQKAIKALMSYNQENLFLNVYMIFLTIIFAIQTVLVCVNIFYFSKDLEMILHFPIKPVELLVAKLITLESKLYITEIIFAIVPLTMYGILTSQTILYYLFETIILIIFPIAISLIISIVMMCAMKILKYIKNKDLVQFILTFILLSVVVFVEYTAFGTLLKNKGEGESSSIQIEEGIKLINNKIKEANSCLLFINPLVETLEKPNMYGFINIIKILFMDFVLFILFIITGKKTYLKDVLKNISYLTSVKNNKKKRINKYKKHNKSFSYLIKEIRNLFRNPMFFMQCVYPIITCLMITVMMSMVIIPKFREALNNEAIRNQFHDLSFDITAVCIILGIIQIFFMLTPASLTAVSRDGKNAKFIKYIPISLYSQFIYKGVPQIIINIISIIGVVTTIHITIPEIEVKYIFEISMLAILLNIINSYIMLIVDLINPKLEWDTEYAVLKQNNNKIFQYVFSIISILFLIYMDNIFSDLNLEIALGYMAIIFISIIIVINIFVKIKIKSLYKKIY